MKTSPMHALVGPKSDEYNREDFLADAEYHHITDETAVPPACLDDSAPVGTYFAAIPKELLEMVRCYWGSGRLPDSYELAGIIAKLPVQYQWYRDMQIDWAGTDPEWRDTSQNEYLIAYIAGIEAKIEITDTGVAVLYGRRRIELIFPVGIYSPSATFLDNIGTLHVHVLLHGPTALSRQHRKAHDRIVHVTAYRVFDVLGEPSVQECADSPLDICRGFSLALTPFIPALNRRHYTRKDDIVTEYLGATPLRRAIGTDRSVVAIDSAGNFLVRNRNLVRVAPIWVAVDATPTEPPILTDYPDLDSGTSYTYSPDGMLYAAFRKFTRVYRPVYN